MHPPIYSLYTSWAAPRRSLSPQASCLTGSMAQEALSLQNYSLVRANLLIMALALAIGTESHLLDSYPCVLL